MAYNKAFNPDALPAHAEPDQAAQAMGQLSLQNRKPSPNAPRPPAQSPYNSSQGRPSSPGNRRNSPAGLAAQRAAYGPQAQTNQVNYGDANSQALNYNRLNSPPPPANYGYGPRPHVEPVHQRRASHPASNLPSQQHQQQQPQPPRTPAPPDADSSELYDVFQRANSSRTGALTSHELGSALVNSDFTPFDGRTIASLMKMFTTSLPNQPNGPTISYTEFQNLWRFLAAWRELFERFDEDRSGRISQNEFSKALVAFGYRLSQQFVSLLYHTFQSRNTSEQRRGSAHSEGMSFDFFVQACISLKRITDVFKGYDDDRDGYVTMSFEEFLTEILKLRE